MYLIQTQEGTDHQTVVIQCSGRYIGAVRERINHRANSHVFVGGFIQIDVFVDTGYNPINRPDRTWLRIAYEDLDGNPCPSPSNGRFIDADIYRLVKGNPPLPEYHQDGDTITAIGYKYIELGEDE